MSKPSTKQPTKQSQTRQVSTVSCPTCKTEVRWLEENTFRPFCSDSCKNKDFIGWANEEKSVAGSSSYDDIFSEDILSNGLESGSTTLDFFSNSDLPDNGT